MQKLFRVFTALAAAALLLAPPAALAQDTKKAAAKADAPAKGKDLYSPAFFDFMLKQRIAQGQPDTPELRQAVRDELNTRELLVREAKKKGLDKAPGMKTEMDLSAQTVLVRAYMADFLKSHPVSDEALHKEYESRSATSWSTIRPRPRRSSRCCKRATSSTRSPRRAPRTPVRRPRAAISTGTLRRTSSSLLATR
jgi:hypothetical protein